LINVFPANRQSIREVVFRIKTEADFVKVCLDVFRYQVSENPVYAEWTKALGIDISSVKTIAEIPFLPVSFFKTHVVKSGINPPEIIFTSSGTTGMVTSSHAVADLKLYQESYLKGFELFYGKPLDYVIIGLLPAYLERPGSSLVNMAEGLSRKSGNPQNGFFLYEHSKLKDLLGKLAKQNQKTWLIGVSFALLDFAELHPPAWENLTVVETGGMKGRRKEMIREDLHETIRSSWNVTHLHSEYGMTELLSQAYLRDNGRFETPPWMKIMIRETSDPLTYAGFGKTGGVNVIDLANLDSCAFIATQDLGRQAGDGSFEILGRFDNSDVRGCNLLVE